MCAQSVCDVVAVWWCVSARPALSVSLESCRVLILPIIRLEAIKAALIIIARLRSYAQITRNRTSAVRGRRNELHLPKD